MKYIVRLNPKAAYYNPLTGKTEIKVDRIWEVEQVADKDSEKVIWHCANVRINNISANQFFVVPKVGEPPWEFTAHGICVRGQDNAIEIKTGRHDASGR